ncbi:LOW QUALITY PROTEIN: hypothetical protein TorRG33x02_314350 [Trema orientale]|uniref:Uncharacterized protein n=1 Tax=Trema orientale TaxID=63057 RepID=A0A2P5BNY9_TREOI|nr:LOW QUALITY PROTEIN: hypothetical protein TorRG33x02_314350 [Trema orientale]
MINKRSFTIVKQPNFFSYIYTLSTLFHKTLNYILPTSHYGLVKQIDQFTTYRDKNSLHQSSNKGDSSSLKITDPSPSLRYLMLNKKIENHVEQENWKTNDHMQSTQHQNTPHTHTPFIDFLL